MSDERDAKQELRVSNAVKRTMALYEAMGVDPVEAMAALQFMIQVYEWAAPERAGEGKAIGARMADGFKSGEGAKVKS